MTVEIFVRGRDGVDGDQIEAFTKLSVVLRFRDVSSWSLEAPRTDSMASLCQPGAAIVVERDGKVLISGPLTQPERQWGGDNGDDLLIASGVSDDVVLWDRVVYPIAPRDAVKAFSDDDYDVATGRAEAIMKHYVIANCTAAAFGGPDRAVPGLTIAPDLGRGLTVTGRGRFQTVGEMLQDMGVAGGGLGFRVEDLSFDVYEPSDRSDDAVFSTEMGNLIDFDYKTAIPQATHVVCAGGGQGVDRTFAFGADAAASTRWNRRIEVFQDARDTQDPNELAQRVTQTLTDKAEHPAFTLTPLDTPDLTFGEDYFLGDLVSVPDELDVAGTVNQVELTLDENGETIKPSVSSPTTATALAVLKAFDRIRDLQRRTSALERTL
jgi:Siphovirus ReqiPepy6 Gp37-like protein